MRQLAVAARLNAASTRLRQPRAFAVGHVSEVTGLSVGIAGLSSLLAVGDRVSLQGRSSQIVPAEITGFRGGTAQAMPLGALAGIGPGARALAQIATADTDGQPMLTVTNSWLGRIVDPLGAPLDGKGALPMRAGAACPGSPAGSRTTVSLGAAFKPWGPGAGFIRDVPRGSAAWSVRGFRGG